MLNWLLSIMVLRPEGLTEEEAMYLAKELPLRTHPANFKEAHKIVEALLRDVD